MAPRGVLAASLLAAASADKINLSISDCGAAHGKVDSISPPSITTGQTSTVTGKGSVDQTVESGTYKLEIKALGVSLQTCTGDICGAAQCDLPLSTGSIKFAGLPCPVSAGPVTLSMDVTVAATIPSQLAVLEIDLTSGDLLCAKIATSPGSFKQIAERVNSLSTTWTAQEPSKFANVEDVKPFLGAFVPGDAEYEEPPTVEIAQANGIPDAFDAATNWPDCAPVISLVRDQSACGTCWAFGSVESFEDRACIATGKPIKYSPEDTGFNSNAGMGCNGGNSAWTWFKNVGVVTGGDYTDIGGGDTCLPYSLAPCAHHVPPTAKYPACPGEGPSPRPGRQCSESSYGSAYAADKVKALTAYSVKGIEQIQTEVMTNGPLYVTFTVYDDFPTYKSGVYHRTSWSALGGHAVENVGWGTLDGQAYWRIKNSWNEEWGDAGHFKIVRGTNECGIEAGASGGTFQNSPMPPAPPGECEFTDCMTCLFSYCGGGGSCGGSHDQGTFKCQCSDGGLCGDDVGPTEFEYTAQNGQIV